MLKVPVSGPAPVPRTARAPRIALPPASRPSHHGREAGASHRYRSATPEKFELKTGPYPGTRGVRFSKTVPFASSCQMIVSFTATCRSRHRNIATARDPVIGPFGVAFGVA